MAMSTREARRRRIAERGEDRLALITGRIQTLEPSSSPLPSPSSSSLLSSTSLSVSSPHPQSHHTHTFSSPPLLLRQDQVRHDYRVDPPSFVSPNVINENDDENVPSTPVERDDTSIEYSRNVTTDSENKVEPHLRKCETNVDDIRSPSVDISNLVSSMVEDSHRLTPPDTKRLSRTESQLHHPKLFTARRISSSITASENLRILCSITIALLVVLSHLSLPILNEDTVKCFITSRPLYLVLLSNVTIVLARLLVGKRGGSLKAEEEARKAPSSALETGLLMYKAFSAAFMDCSVYAVVVVSGLSLLQHLGARSF